jgi:hypothetical protein
MLISPELTRTSTNPLGGFERPRQTALVYQTMTIAAMLLLLCSMWVF